ncbi:hypothetical protein K435DRAFT_864997 [Dendrothele bispora CBS 962.96]|uniref:Uncharacterized protein n=1 Tax=Dendrothele bispora (strain CBS 962.96) TaxID=1314807 RepID=A0A4S8LKH0_DENBC|nr:hypothetical protein K435DRAFT_864997 [Dendrothele bispora CBS 962.96]
MDTGTGGGSGGGGGGRVLFVLGFAPKKGVGKEYTRLVFKLSLEPWKKVWKEQYNLTRFGKHGMISYAVESSRRVLSEGQWSGNRSRSCGRGSKGLDGKRLVRLSLDEEEEDDDNDDDDDGGDDYLAA